MESVPGVLVTLSPWARLPNSLPNARDHVCARIGSLTSFLYFVMDSPVWGCITGAQKCSHVHGMACEVGRGAYDWMAIALSAACEYRRGVSRAIRGERRGLSGGCMSGVAGVALGSIVGVVVGNGCALGTVVGAGVGSSGGVMWRVCR